MECSESKKWVQTGRDPKTRIFSQPNENHNQFSKEEIPPKRHLLEKQSHIGGGMWSRLTLEAVAKNSGRYMNWSHHLVLAVPLRNLGGRARQI